MKLAQMRGVLVRRLYSTASRTARGKINENKFSIACSIQVLSPSTIAKSMTSWGSSVLLSTMFWQIAEIYFQKSVPKTD